MKVTIELDVNHILAYGTNHSIMFLEGNKKGIYIPRNLYYILKEKGVPTGQKLRYERKSR